MLPEKDLSPQVISDAIKVFLVQQGLAYWSVKCTVVEMCQDIAPEVTVFVYGIGPSFLAPGLHDVPRSKAACVHEAEHVGGVVGCKKIQMRVLLHIRSGAEPEPPRHSKAKQNS